ncbi:hypothetical protein BH24ACT12_BH24ACT12_23940 [soil metagenome]
MRSTGFTVRTGRRVAVVLMATVMAGVGTAHPRTHVDALATTPANMPTGQWFADDEWGDDDSDEDEDSSSQDGTWKADKDLGSLFTIAKQYGAQNAWGTSGSDNRKILGTGVDVAVIDTGVAPVAGLEDPTRVVNGPDLSFESQSPNTRHLDGYGHGTHMSAIIAGRDADIPAGGEDDAKHFAGVAPGARIVNLKVGTADGAADVSQVIAAIDWAVQHRNSGGLNIRVINLSYGTRSTQSYTIDPLAHAVENAWRHGIVVVTAAGNNGPGTALSMPAADPYVIAVGAVDHVGTDTSDDDRVSDFTNTGTPIRRPDLLAPGKSVVSLRTPGSYADRSHPEGLVTGDRHQRFFRGSGTSQAAAVVSGAVALLLQQRPKLNPDQVKRLLTSTADRLKSSLDPAQGRGVLDIKGALEASTPSALWSRQTWIPSTGLGTLEASRGDNQVVDPLNGTVLTGEVDALGQPWDARSWSAASSAGEAWSGGTWNARSWSGADWTGSSWTARSWSSAEWTARSWSGVDWSARSWSDAVWTSSGWTSLDLLARSWSQEAWASRAWHGDTWAASDVW